MKIGIIDDHPMVRLGLEAAISTTIQDVDVKGYDSPREIIKDSKNQTFDLLLLDYHIPQTKPEANFKQLSETFNQSKILFFSSDENLAVISRVAELGADGFVVKSSNTNLLIAAINLVLAGGTYFPKNVAINNIETSAGLEGLTNRQRQTAELLAKRLSNKEIARSLNITESTVKQHVVAIYKELGLSGRKAAISWLTNRIK